MTDDHYRGCLAVYTAEPEDCDCGTVDWDEKIDDYFTSELGEDTS